MKHFLLAALMASTLATPMAIAPLAAQSRGEVRDSRRDVREERRELRDAQRYGDRRDVRDERRDVRDARRELRDDRRDWRSYRNYDWNRPQNRGQAYYADRYYRDGRYYQERRLSRNDRVYRGSNGRYYCRRPDGTTGLIVGAAAGGLLGNTLANGRSSLLATLIGAGAGGLLGREIERGSVRCR